MMCVYTPYTVSVIIPDTQLGAVLAGLSYAQLSPLMAKLFFYIRPSMLDIITLLRLIMPSLRVLLKPQFLHLGREQLGSKPRRILRDNTET